MLFFFSFFNWYILVIYIHVIRSLLESCRFGNPSKYQFLDCSFDSMYIFSAYTYIDLVQSSIMDKYFDIALYNHFTTIVIKVVSRKAAQRIDVTDYT